MPFYIREWKQGDSTHVGLYWSVRGRNHDQFRNHEIIGDIVPLAKRYAEEGADELVFYDITASSDGRVVDKSWVSRVAEVIDIPFCVAGGIKSAEDASRILQLINYWFIFGINRYRHGSIFNPKLNMR